MGLGRRVLQVRKVLEKMHKNDLKAWGSCHLRKKRDTLILQEEKKISSRYHKLGKFKLDIRW